MRDLAKASGVAASSISEWVSGRSPNLTAIYKIAKCLDVSIETLAFGEDPCAARERFELVLYRIEPGDIKEKLYEYRK